MRLRGVDVVIPSVDIAVLRVDIAILGVDIAIFGVDITTLGVDTAILGVDIAILGVDIAILRRQEKWWGLQGEGEEGEVRCVRRPEAGWSARELGDTRRTRDVERRVISRFWKLNPGEAWIVEEPYNVASEDVGWLLDFTKSPETINVVVPGGRL